MTEKTKTVLLRNIPQKVHREMKIAAAETGKTLQGFIIDAAADAAKRKDGKL